MRLLVPMAALCAIAGTTAGPDAVVPVVPCTSIIEQAASPHPGYRLVLGTISVPPAYLPRTVDLHASPWRYWEKAGLVVRAGRVPVEVTVPATWRGGAAITWGNGVGIVSSLRVAPCPSPPGVWNAYAGGFYLRARSACVPLVFRVGSRATTVRFGVGRRCR
jgi:hypothetical protein